MAYPTKYARQFDYQSYQNANPTRPLPGDKVNVDLNYVVTSIDEIVDFIEGVTRSDGLLANQSVGLDQLTAALRASLSLTTAGSITSTDNAIPRYDGVNGAIQNSIVTLGDSGTLSGARVVPTTKATGIGRTLEDHFDDVLSIQDFAGITATSSSASAVDCRAGIQTAMDTAAAAGKILSGNGLWYGVSGRLDLPDGLTLVDFKFKQLTPNPAAHNCRTLNKNTGVGNVTLRRGVINGNGATTDANTLSEAAKIYFAGVDNIVVDDVEVYGEGPGYGIAALFCDDTRISNCYVHDMRWQAASDPGTEQIVGIRVIGSNCVIRNSRVRNIRGQIGSAGFIGYQTDGIDAGGTSVLVANCEIDGAGEGIDISGSDANVDVWINHTVLKNIGSIAIKWAHNCSDGGSVGCRVYDAGRAACAFIGGRVDDAHGPRNIKIYDMVAHHTGSGGQDWTDSPASFLAMESPDGTTANDPIGCEFINCQSIDDSDNVSGAATTKWGFNDTTTNKLTRIRGARSVGHTTAAVNGFTAGVDYLDSGGRYQNIGGMTVYQAAPTQAQVETDNGDATYTSGFRAKAAGGVRAFFGWRNTNSAAPNGVSGVYVINYDNSDILFYTSTTTLRGKIQDSTGKIIWQAGADFSGTVTATLFSGSGASLTSIPTTALTGALQAAQFPALTGDITTTAGSYATTLATAQAGAHTWAATQTFTLAPVFTNQSGSRSALGLGTIATQAASAVAITGGTVDGTPIGGTTPAAVRGTNVTATAKLLLNRSVMSLVAGLNSNIPVSTSFNRISGPTGAFSLGGFAAGGDGDVLEVYNTASQTMTIVNADVGSTAANQILTLTGADVVLRASARSFASFIYDGAASRWVLRSYN